MENNAIVFLGTGSGKTFIATMMIKELGQDLRCCEKKTVFLVNSVPLVKQQSEFLRAQTPYKVADYCGADNVDNFTPTKWEQEFAENQVLVMVLDTNGFK